MCDPLFAAGCARASHVHMNTPCTCTPIYHDQPRLLPTFPALRALLPVRGVRVLRTCKPCAHVHPIALNNLDFSRLSALRTELHARGVRVLRTRTPRAHAHLVTLSHLDCSSASRCQNLRKDGHTERRKHIFIFISIRYMQD